MQLHHLGPAANVLVVLAGSASLQAQVTAAIWGTLAGKYNERIKPADSPIMDLVGTALNAGNSSGMLSQLGTNTQCLSP